MGIFKKKEINILTPAEEKIKELYNEELYSRKRLEGKVKEAYAISMTLNVLPDCPDKEELKRKLLSAQNKVRAEIGEHDRLVYECTQLNKKLNNNYVSTPDSHTIIINTMRRIIEK